MTAEKLERGTPAYHRLAWAMRLAGLATFATFYCVQPMLPLFSEGFGVGAGEASLVVSITIGPMALALIAAGIVSDRHGRRPLMIASLFAAGLLTLASAAVPGWHGLLALRLLVGLALAGVPAVAMAYIVEEIDDRHVGHAMGLYIGGTAFGGMTGRLLGGVIGDLAGWRVAVAVVGIGVLICAVAFWRATPASSHFAPRRVSLHGWARGLARLLGDRAIPWLFAQAFLLMGAFVALYNYAAFRLVEPPYSLSHSIVGAIFLLFVLGSLASGWAGAVAARIGARRSLWRFVLLFLAGLLITLAAPLALVVLGIAVATIGFFGAHSIASAWVGRRARDDRAQASALYLFAYYLGGSVMGSLGGAAWSMAHWPGVVAFASALLALALVAALRLASVTPLPARS